MLWMGRAAARSPPPRPAEGLAAGQYRLFLYLEAQYPVDVGNLMIQVEQTMGKLDEGGVAVRLHIFASSRQRVAVACMCSSRAQSTGAEGGLGRLTLVENGLLV